VGTDFASDLASPAEAASRRRVGEPVATADQIMRMINRLTVAAVTGIAAAIRDQNWLSPTTTVYLTFIHASYVLADDRVAPTGADTFGPDPLAARAS
jgi:hypothetical protein